MSGIMWIGHLWYFNFTQAPTMPKIPAELKPAVSKFILPQALFWFRWGAMATVITGLLTSCLMGTVTDALLLGISAHSAHLFAIGTGMWLGIIMWFNVWFIIWPNQKKVMGLTEADDDGKKKAARTAFLFSRVNTLLSVPLLYSMASVHFY
jgi:uncharacterized membrane protein